MPLTTPNLTAGERLLLFWGKVRRLALHAFDREYVRKSLERREGECRRCGACCNLAHVCPFLGYDDEHGTKCARHVTRSLSCIVFPIDEKDLRDRDLVNPDTPCGYSFNGKKTPLRDHVTKWILSPGLGKLVTAGNGNGRRRSRKRRSGSRVWRVVFRLASGANGNSRPGNKNQDLEEPAPVEKQEKELVLQD